VAVEEQARLDYDVRMRQLQALGYLEAGEEEVKP
jgi:hypothetical protein